LQFKLELVVPALTTLKLLGAAGLVSYALAKLTARADLLGYSRYLLVSVPVASMPKMPRGYSVRELSAADLRSHEIDVPDDVKNARFAQGLTCLAAFTSKDELVGVTWLGIEPFVEDEVHIRFDPPHDAGWDTGLWIKPEFRLGRGFAALWAGTAQWLTARGRRWSMSRIADYNLASIRSHQRMGAVTTGRMIVFRVCKWQYSPDAKPGFARIDAAVPPVAQLSSPEENSPQSPAAWQAVVPVG
jgi:hypothetical protein